jgi:hypothetical protein
MKILNSEGLKMLYQDRKLKKLVLRFAKKLRKKYGYLELYIDLFEGELDGEDVKLPSLIIGIPDDLKIKDETKFMENIGNLLDESGNLTDIHELFLIAIDKQSILEEQLNNA